MSVVIPAYNAERTVGATIDSVLAQTFKDVEVLVIDDGSQDSTASVAASYGEPVRCVTTPNGGVSRARNTGIEHSSGELVAFLDADDLWRTGKLERQLALLDSNAEIGFVTCAATAVRDDLTPLGELPAVSAADPTESLLLRSMVLGPVSSALAPRELLVRLGGFDPRFSQCADWDLFLRAGSVAQIAAVPEPLVLYRAEGEKMSSDIGLLERDTFAVLDAFFASDAGRRYDGLRRRAYSNHWMIISGSYLHARRPRAAVRCMLRGVRAHPPNVTRVLGLPLRRLRR